MNKHKIVKKNSIIYFKMSSLKGQQLNMREIETISKREIDGLFPVEVKQKGSSFKLDYNITGYISLKEYLLAPINKLQFSSLLDNIFGILKSLQSAYFNYKSLMLDFKNIMINPSTKKVAFIYIPIQYFDNGETLKDFFLKIAHGAVFSSNEDTTYVREYISILNNGINFSLFELEEYIKRISNKSLVTLQKSKCPNCGFSNNNDAKYCLNCGHELIQEIKNKDTTYNPLKNQNADMPTPPQPTINDDIKPVKNNTQKFSEGTTVLGSEKLSEGTTVLGTENSEQPRFPYLIREKNNEKIIINKPSFRIGKESRYCDYFVSDNNAVSRSHADIITKNDGYYIVDNNSTNKTYINDLVIPINKEVEIFTENKVKLGNENFIFYIESGGK